MFCTYCMQFVKFRNKNNSHFLNLKTFSNEMKNLEKTRIAEKANFC